MKFFLSILLISVSVGCNGFRTSTPIPFGVYFTPDTMESVQVDQHGLTFTVCVPKLLERQVVTRGPYTYERKESGRIRISASSNDSVFLFGIDQYRWVWTGESIMREDPSGVNQPTFFTLMEAKKQ